MKRKIILSVVFALLLAGIYGYTEYNRKNKDLLNEKPAFSVDAASLIQLYEENAAAFDTRYTGKVITVTGTIKKIDAAENPVVISLGNEGEFSTVQCSMDSTHASLYSSIKEGQAISLKGLCTGGRTEELFGTDIILNRCVVVGLNKNLKHKGTMAQ